MLLIQSLSCVEYKFLGVMGGGGGLRGQDLFKAITLRQNTYVFCYHNMRGK